MNRKPGHDEYGWPLYDAAWAWTQAVRPALIFLAAIHGIAVLAALLSAQ